MKIKIDPKKVSSMDEAIKVLDEVNDNIKNYDNCTINDYLHALGESPLLSLNNIRYGWISTDKFLIQKSDDGSCIIHAPKAELLN